MHEGSFARAILLSVRREAQRAGMRRVLKIKVLIGEAHAVVEEFLKTMFDMMKGEYGLGEAALEVEKVELEVKCPACGKIYHPRDPVFICPECGTPGGEILRGNELHLLSIEGEK